MVDCGDFMVDCGDCLGLRFMESMSAIIPLLICSIVSKSIRICFCFGMYCLEIEDRVHTGKIV